MYLLKIQNVYIYFSTIGTYFKLIFIIYFSCFVIRSTNDIRPSLLLTHEQRRLHNQMKKKQKCELQNKIASVKVLEEQRRQEGLEKAIDSNNKGFSLLQKMGYKPGSGIGKNSN